MNVVPHMKFPTLEEVLAYVDKFPCVEKAREVLVNETSLGNVIQEIGDAGCMPDETVVVIDFEQDAKKEYLNGEIKELRNGIKYRFVKYLDDWGALYIRFFIQKGMI